MSQAPPEVSPQNNALYVLLGVVGGLCLICGGFSVAIMACVSSLAPLSAGAKATPADGDPRGGPAPDNDRIAVARTVAEAFLDDLRRGKYEEAHRKTGGLLQVQEAKDLREILRTSAWPRKVDKITLGKGSGPLDRPKFSGSAEGSGKKTDFALVMGLEGTEYRVIAFEVAE
jgi:hypothetical protein